MERSKIRGMIKPALFWYVGFFLVSALAITRSRYTAWLAYGLVVYLMVVNGVLGWPVGPWEAIVWGLTMLALITAVRGYRAMAASARRELAIKRIGEEVNQDEQYGIN